MIEGMIGAFIGGMAALFYHDRHYWRIWWKYKRFGKSVLELEYRGNPPGVIDARRDIWIDFKKRHPDIIILFNGVEIK